MMTARTQLIFIYVALPCEAKPLIEHFKLSKDLNCRAFEIYSNEDICLTVTGIGKCAMAAGVAYTQAGVDAAGNPVMLNLGIAGHAEHPVGQAFLAGKLIDADSGKNYYPPLTYTSPCAIETIETGSRPQLTYAEPHLYDMEAAAFYQTAVRFTTGELTSVFKVVSDNRESSVALVTSKLATELIAARLPELLSLLSELRSLQNMIRTNEPEQLRLFLDAVPFTANERQQLRTLLLRWESLTGGERLDIENPGFNNAKAALNWLTQKIEAVDYVL